MALKLMVALGIFLIIFQRGRLESTRTEQLKNGKIPTVLWTGRVTSGGGGGDGGGGRRSLKSATTKQLNDGNQMPLVALGTGRGSSGGKPHEEVRYVVLWALQAGYRHIDTAPSYRDEREVGQGIADGIASGIVTRDQVFVTTKLWNNRHAKEQVVPALRESLEKLGLAYVDLYLINYPISMTDDNRPANIDYLETWRGMEEAKNLGLAKSIGVSNFNIQQLDRLFANSNVQPAVIQVEVNPTMTQYPLVAHCARLGVAVMAYTPFGFMVERFRADAPPPRFDEPLLVLMAAKYDKTPAQIVLRYLIERGVIPIPKSSTKTHLAEDIALFDFSLTSSEVATIDAFNKNVRVINPTSWKEFPDYPFEKY